MEVPKRLQFTTVGPSGKGDKKKAVVPTVRFELDLSESNATTCPEFFYSDLLKPVLGAAETSTSEDPFGDDAADEKRLAAIAKSFEDKYNKPEGKKKKKKKWRDMEFVTDLGDGYDEEDTFIDNSEAYDEVMPGTLTTALGGFYINSGLLDFKEVSDDSDDDFHPGSTKKSKKRRISSSEDSDEEKKVVKCPSFRKNNVPKKKLKDGMAVDGEVKKKKKKIIIDGEKPFKKPKQPQDKDKLKQNKSSTVAALLKSTSPNLNGEGSENGVLSSPDGSDSNEGTPSLKSNISMVIDSVVSMAARDDSDSHEFEDNRREIDPESIPKLPPALPQGMETKIEELKRQANESRDGKCKFFTANVNKILLELEMSSKQMTVGNRSAMFGYLAAFLPCSKDTLLKRAKTLRVKDLEDRIKEPLEKLRTTVNRMMPALLEKYDADCLKAAQEKSEEANKEGHDKESVREDMGTESDDEEKTDHSEATKKRPTGPRKKFVWDNNVRALLCDVVRVKMHTYQISKVRAQTAEEYCKTFLDSDVRPIWPKGWMQTRVLYKESKSSHTLWTNPQKPKKALFANKTPGSAGSPGQTVKPTNPVSAPPGVNLSKVTAVGSSKVDLGMTLSKSVNVSKNTPIIVNSSKPAVNSQSTPNVPPKKIVPTLLDYAKSNSGLLGNSNLASNMSAQSNSASQSSLMKSLLSPGQLKPDDARVPGSNTQQTKNSWDHIVSDILRSSIGEQYSGQSPPKQNVLQLQRQNSTPISQAENSFYAQFEKYAMLAQSQVVDHGAPKQSSPIPSTSAGQMTLARAQQKMIQQQVLKQQIEKRVQLQKQDQQLKREQQQKQDQQLTREQQLKLLQEQTIMLQEKQKQLQHEQIAKQVAASMAKGQKLKVTNNQSGQKMQMPNNQSGQKMQMSNNQSGQKTQMTIASSQSKQPPSQSPMSVTMNRNSMPNQPGQKVTPKQLVHQFSASVSQGMSLMAENVIRQQLSDAQTGSVSKPTLQGKVVHKVGHSNLGLVGDHFGHVSSSTDSLRKSPQSQAGATSLPSSQGRASAPHVIKIQNSQGQVSQGHTVFNNPTTITVTTTNGKPATNLLKSFIGQAQKFTSGHESTNQQRSLLQGGASAQVSPTKARYSPTSMKSSQQQGRPIYSGAGDAQSKPYTMHSTTTPRPVPGYQSVRLSNLSGDHLASYQTVQQQQQQQHRSPDALFGSQLGQRPTPGSPSYQLSPEQHRYNALHYGYHGYKDSTK